MRVLLFGVLLLALWGCGSGGDGGSSVPGISGTYLYDSANSRVALTVTSDDNVNYTGTLTMYDYRFSPPLYVKSGVVGKVGEPVTSGKYAGSGDAGYLFDVTASYVDTNIADLDWSHDPVDDWRFQKSSNPNLPITTIPFALSLRRTSNTGYVYSVSGNLTKQ